MTTLLFTQIVFVCLIGAMSPGPSMVVVINNTIFKNKINGIITEGDLFQIFLKISKEEKELEHKD